MISKKLALTAVICASLTGCGLMTNSDFAMVASERGLKAFSDMHNGLARAQARKDEYFRHRRIQETEQTARDAQPGFWNKLMFGGLAAKKPAEYDTEIGS